MPTTGQKSPKEQEMDLEAIQGQVQGAQETAQPESSEISEPGAPETAPETVPEQAPEAPSQKPIEEKKEEAPATAASAPPAEEVTEQKEEIVTNIENVLQEDLEEVYFKMTPEQQQAFKHAGEETAGKISVMLKDVKVKVKKVLELVTNWLKMIPGVNKFFLEQEAQIKTDKILKLKKSGDQPAEDKQINEDLNKI